jgi:hypothetical protein
VKPLEVADRKRSTALLRLLGNRPLNQPIVSDIHRASMVALLLGLFGCVSTRRPDIDLRAGEQSVVPGTYAVLICRGLAPCAAKDTGSIYSDGTVVILDRETSSLADSLRRAYASAEISDSAFGHVQVCYVFRRHPPIEGREGPDLRGFSDLLVSQQGDSVSFSLGESADAGYEASVRMKDGVMTGTATGWNSQELFRVDTVNGQRIFRRRTKAELAAVGRQGDRLVGRRVGAPDERICLDRGKY